MEALAFAALNSGHYVQWGVLSISLTNLAIIVAMLVVFLLALVLPFPGGDDEVPPKGGSR